MAEAQKEILESIRDIISGKGTAEDDILELTQVVNPDGSVSEIKKPQPAAKPLQPQAAAPKASNDVLSDIDSLLNDKPKPIDKDVELEFAPKPEKFEIAEEFSATDVIAPRKDNIMPQNPDAIISPESAETAKHALSELTNRLKKEGKETNKVEPSAPFRSGATIEDLVVEMLKPMMKDWLDKNLPKLVNEIVQKEIQKLIPRD